MADISDNDPFHAGGADGAVSSTCTATLSGVSGSTQIVNGRLVTSLDAATANPDTEIDFAHTWNPDPNTVYSGSLNNVGDSWRIVFNEQILGPDSITVNAVHLYLLGPTAIGDMIIGQSHCALTQAAPATAPAAAADSYTATAGQTLSVAAPGVLANDTDSDGGPLSAATLAPIPPPSTGRRRLDVPLRPRARHRVPGGGRLVHLHRQRGLHRRRHLHLPGPRRPGRHRRPATVTITVNPGVSHAVADFAGDGVTDLSVFRPSGGQWLIADGTTSFWGLSGRPGGAVRLRRRRRSPKPPSTGPPPAAGTSPARTRMFFGLPGDMPVPGHYGGDTNCDLAVFRPSTGAWYIQNQPTQYLGLSGDIPVPAAYRGGNLTLPAVYRPSTGAWYIAGPAAGSVELAYYGLSGDIPVPADYTGTGTATIAVWRPSAGAWYIQNQATQYLGLPGRHPRPRQLHRRRRRRHRGVPPRLGRLVHQRTGHPILRTQRRPTPPPPRRRRSSLLPVTRRRGLQCPRDSGPLGRPWGPHQRPRGWLRLRGREWRTKTSISSSGSAPAMPAPTAGRRVSGWPVTAMGIRLQIRPLRQRASRPPLPNHRRLTPCFQTTLEPRAPDRRVPLEKLDPAATSLPTSSWPSSRASENAAYGDHAQRLKLPPDNARRHPRPPQTLQVVGVFVDVGRPGGKGRAVFHNALGNLAHRGQ